MKTKGVVIAISALIGTLAAMENSFLFIMIYLCIFPFFIKMKKMKGKELWAILLIFALFFIRSEIEILQNQTKLSGNEEKFILFFQDIGKINGDVLTMEVTDQKSSETLLMKYKIKSENEKQFLQKALFPGLVCKVEGILEEPEVSSNPNAFNYKEYLRRNQIHWLLTPFDFTIKSCQDSPTFITSIKRFRSEGIRYLERHFPKDSVPLAAALLFGSDDLISPETMDDYRELGIVHLLAISGLHIAIIVAIFYQLLLRMGMTKEKCVIVLLICLPLYGMLTGASPSVNRSIMMTMILLIARRWGTSFHISPLDGISFTFLIYVFISPYAIYNVGFQLSFLVTFSLLLSLPFILEKCEHPLLAMLTTSFISMLSSAPILLTFFYEFSVISLLVNLIYVPLFNIVILPLVLISYLSHLLLTAAVDPLLYLLNKMIQWTNGLTELISQFPYSGVLLGKPDPFILVLYIGGFFYFFVLWEKLRKPLWQKSYLLLIPVCLFISQVVLTTFSKEGEVTFIDVGQGDSIFIKLPYGKGTYLIDTGGNQIFDREPWQEKQRSYEVGRDTVVPFLKSKGVAKLDKLIITHGDLDHAGGATAIMEELRVKELVLPDNRKKSELETKLLQQAKDKEINVRFVHAGNQWKSGEHSFKILSPKEGNDESGNNSSIVIYTELGGLNWLFTGDLEEDGETKLLNENRHLAVDVLKVGHHGSKTSTTDLLLETLSPKIGIISVGRDNRFGHPNKEVLGRLEKGQVNILRTDESGAITYSFVKKTGTFWVYRP
ncbi:DNA internalization-related competence protein ComEC/Rec2 [Niallia sp. Krafla_26]|uniref:DNA internalization-related competence protein ComEC/Rec2 n=1 Tax=Niallia sp. Krafla_26 TaxID=3064703 RepID=UPI003D1645EE